MKIEIITLKKDKIKDFALERNELLKKAVSEWILFLDSDEKMTHGLKNEIKVLDPDGYNGFHIYRDNFFLGRKVGTDKILRLARKNSGRWSRRVHETWRVKGNIRTLKNPIIHNSAENLHAFINKINYYSTLHAEENIKEGKKSNLFKIIFFPAGKFIHSLIIGRGFVFSMLQSFHSFLSWSKQWKLQNA